MNHECWASIRLPQLRGMTQYATWFEMWEAASAIYYMCVLPHGVNGLATSIGRAGPGPGQIQMYLLNRPLTVGNSTKV